MIVINKAKFIGTNVLINITNNFLNFSVIMQIHIISFAFTSKNWLPFTLFTSPLRPYEQKCLIWKINNVRYNFYIISINITTSAWIWLFFSKFRFYLLKNGKSEILWFIVWKITDFLKQGLPCSSWFLTNISYLLDDLTATMRHTQQTRR